MNAPLSDREKALMGMGESRLRKEDARFIQGKGNYVDDIKMPGITGLDLLDKVREMNNDLLVVIMTAGASALSPGSRVLRRACPTPKAKTPRAGINRYSVAPVRRIRVVAWSSSDSPTGTFTVVHSR